MQIHHSSSTIEFSNTNTSTGYDNGTWCTIHTYFFTRIAYQPILKPRSIFQKIHLPVQTSQPHAEERDTCGLAVPAAQPLAQAAAANAVATAPAARVVLSTALGV